MIGGGWDGEPMIRPEGMPPTAGKRRVLVVTGSRAEFGLLTPVMRAIAAHPQLELAVVAGGSHLLQPELTVREVKAAFKEHLVDLVPMQIPGRTTRSDDVAALGRGIARLGRVLDAVQPDWTLVLGDRIEAFATASAAAIGGRALAHVHGGDRAEGVADESMRHAISKLAHLHLAATEQSAERLRRMGERPAHVHVVGSPAIDGLADIPALDDARYTELGSPEAIAILHPIGRPDEHEEAVAAAVLEAVLERAPGRVLLMDPNHDPGRAGIVRALDAAERRVPERVTRRAHLPRAQFVGLLKRLALLRGVGRGVMVGNSSSGLIEVAALGVPAVDVGPRQGGRERPASVVSVPNETRSNVARAIEAADQIDRESIRHPYGDGRAGPRIAQLLSQIGPHDPHLLRKQNTY